MRNRRCCGVPIMCTPPKDSLASPPKFSRRSLSISRTRRPRPSNSYAATMPARPPPAMTISVCTSGEGQTRRSVLRAFRPARQVVLLLGSEPVDLHAHGLQLHLRHLLVPIFRHRAGAVFAMAVILQ